MCHEGVMGIQGPYGYPPPPPGQAMYVQQPQHHPGASAGTGCLAACLGERSFPAWECLMAGPRLAQPCCASRYLQQFVKASSSLENGFLV